MHHASKLRVRTVSFFRFRVFGGEEAAGVSAPPSQGKLDRVSRVVGRLSRPRSRYPGDLRTRFSLEVRGALARAERALPVLQVTGWIGLVE